MSREETKESSNQKSQEHKYVFVCTVLVCVHKGEWGEAREKREGEREESEWERGERGRGRGDWGKRDRQRNWGRQVNAGQQIENTSQPKTVEKVWNMWQQFVSCRTEVTYVQVESKTVLKISIINYET